MAALVFKVGALALKTLAKPLGDRFKNWVMTHPQYRQSVLRTAQVFAAAPAAADGHIRFLDVVSLLLRCMHTLCPVLRCVVPSVLSHMPVSSVILCTHTRPQQRIHGFEVMVTRKAEGKEGRAFIGSMTEEKSVELASKIASESFLFAVSHWWWWCSHACMGASLSWRCSAWRDRLQ